MPSQKFFRIIFNLIIYLTVGMFFLTGLSRIGMLLFSKSKTYIAPDVPPAPAALVLGAGLNRDGSAGVVLQDRVRKASELYFSGKVQKLLMSGDNSVKDHNEPGAMRDYALSLGIPEEDIVMDFAGRRTYDSCYRAKAIFGVEKLIVVTQAYHLPRSVFLCNAFDIETLGVPADDAYYRRSSYTFWWTRELFATLNALWDIYISSPTPILGDPEPIFP